MHNQICNTYYAICVHACIFFSLALLSASEVCIPIHFVRAISTAAPLRHALLHLKLNSDIQLAGQTVNKHKRCEYNL